MVRRPLPAEPAARRIRATAGQPSLASRAAPWPGGPDSTAQSWVFTLIAHCRRQRGTKRGTSRRSTCNRYQQRRSGRPRRATANRRCGGLRSIPAAPVEVHRLTSLTPFLSRGLPYFIPPPGLAGARRRRSPRAAQTGGKQTRTGTRPALRAHSAETSALIRPRANLVREPIRGRRTEEGHTRDTVANPPEAAHSGARQETRTLGTRIANRTAYAFTAAVSALPSVMLESKRGYPRREGPHIAAHAGYGGARLNQSAGERGGQVVAVGEIGLAWQGSSGQTG